MARKVRIVITGPTNERWYVTPLMDDGTAGETNAFGTMDAARLFAERAYGGLPIRVSRRRPEKPLKAPRVVLHYFG